MDSMDRRSFLSVSGLGVVGAAASAASAAGVAGVVGPRATWPDEGAMARADRQTDSFDLLRAERRRRAGTYWDAADYNRLPLSWYQAKARELKEKARARGVDGGLFLTNRNNIIYATGLFHSGTERTFAVFLPMDDDDACIWFHPYLDEELVATWWSSDQYAYFDHHHAAGGFPNDGNVAQGDTVNIFRWWGSTLADLGYGGKTIGVDAGGMVEIGILPGQYDDPKLNMTGPYDEPGPSRPTGGIFGYMADELPGSSFVDVADIMIRSRMVKGEEEHRLAQRAEDVWSEVHAFARNYILERGLGTLDQEVRNAAYLWGLDRVMQDIDQAGEPHNAVGITFGINVRSGPVTGYPHPNQMTFSPIERGHALQVATWGGIGGYGGEQYRSYLVAPWTDWQEHVWEVHTRSYEIQAEESYVGNTCSNVAKAVHDHQVANDCAHLIYHRPGHGAGTEGHQPPYQALGDYTVMERGMYFSNEPGLYDPENGFGFNHSNNIVVWDGAGRQMGTAPYSKEWAMLDLG